MQKTGIDYLTHTWNPIAMRCTCVGEGCKNCWHLAMCKRHAANPRLAADVRAARAGGPPVLVAGELDAPLRLRKPAVIGVQFMGDLYHPDVSPLIRAMVFSRTERTPQHTYVILTKRPQQLLADLTDNSMFMTTGPGGRLVPRVLPNVWLGVSVENQKTADERIPILLECPAAVRAVSLEPLLGEVSLEEIPQGEFACRETVLRPECWGDCACGDDPGCRRNGGNGQLRGLDWVIVGGETGPRARPMHPDWSRSIRDQCQTAGVPFFFKGWGECAPCAWGGLGVCPQCGAEHGRVIPGFPDSEPMIRVGKKAAGRLLDGREWNEVPRRECPT